MAEQPPNPEEMSVQEAIEVLQRLAGVGSFGDQKGDWVPPAPLPPRAPVLPAWSESSFRELVEVLPDAVVVVDARGVIVFVNRQTEQLFGYARDELVGEVIEILVPERVRQEHFAMRDGYLAAPRTRALGEGRVLFGLRKDGSEFPVEISLSPLRGASGLLVTGIIRDVSDRKRSEAKFRSLVENIPAVTFIAPLDGSVSELYVSPQIERMLGFTQKEWLEDPTLWFRQLHPEDRDKWNLAFAPTCYDGTPFHSTYRFLARDGRVVWVQGSANVVRDERDRLLFLEGIAFDVTAIKQAEQTLREQARLAALRADVSFALTRTDTLSGMISGCVAALSRDLDASARVWLLDADRGVLSLIAGDANGADAVIPLDDGIREPTHQRNAHGEVVLASYPLLIEGSLLGVMAVFGVPLSAAVLQTLTLIASQVALGVKRKQAEDDLLRANVELERRVRVRTEELTRSLAELQDRTEELRKYSYHATHDIKEPLRNIRVQTQKVRKYADQLPGDSANLLAKVEAQCERMKQLLERLKDYAQVNLDVRPEPVDCCEAAVVALTSLETAIEESGAEVTLGELPTLIGAREHLTLLFQNLIGNALKYRSAERSPRVEVGAQAHAEGWLFWVRDNGSGIEPKYWQKIFGIAERLDAKTSGWGYGLAICEKTVTRHGGRIWVASEPGQGSTFYFTLPAGAQG